MTESRPKSSSEQVAPRTVAEQIRDEEGFSSLQSEYQTRIQECISQVPFSARVREWLTDVQWLVTAAAAATPVLAATWWGDRLGRLSTDEQFQWVRDKVGEAASRITFEDILGPLLILGAYKVWQNAFEKKPLLREQGRVEISRPGEQLLFVIGGHNSNIANALALHDPNGVVPIFQQASGGKHLSNVHERSQKGIPFFLNLDIDNDAMIDYDNSEAWKLLDVGRDNLIRSVNGKEYLVVVGCGEVAEEELGTQAPVDVTHEELYSSIDMIQKRLREKGVEVPDENTVGIYLGSGQASRFDSVTRKDSTDRVIAEKGGINIYVDTWRVMVTRIREVLKEKNLEKVGVRLVSNVPEYLEIVSGIASELGIPNHSGEDDPGDALLLVYERRSDQTRHKAKQLQEEFPTREVIALTSNVESDKLAHDRGIHTICSAEVIEGVINDIKQQLQDGISPEEMQARLDSYTAPLQREQEPS